MRLSLFALALLAAPLASAQRGAPNTEGLFLQLALDGQALSYNEDDFRDANDGAGLAVRVGYGFSPVVTLYGGVDNDYTFAAGKVGARFNFNRGRALRPYLDVALRVGGGFNEVDFGRVSADADGFGDGEGRLSLYPLC